MSRNISLLLEAIIHSLTMIILAPLNVGHLDRLDAKLGLRIRMCFAIVGYGLFVLHLHCHSQSISLLSA